MTDMYEKIKMLRLRAEMSQAELAKRTGYTNRSSIARIEAGDVDLSRTKIEVFAKALHTTPAYLMGWEDEQGNSTVTSKSVLAEMLGDNQIALLNGAEDLTEEQMQDVLKYIQFIKTIK